MKRSLIKQLYLLPILLLLITMSCLFVAPKANALVGSQFNAGRIMDDGIFFNGYSMDVPGIQAFLNAKVPVCDTNGTQAHGSTTRAAMELPMEILPLILALKTMSKVSQQLAKTPIAAM